MSYCIHHRSSQYVPFTSSSCADYTVISPCILIIPHVIPYHGPTSTYYSTTQENQSCPQGRGEKSKKRVQPHVPRPLSVLLCHHITYITLCITYTQGHPFFVGIFLLDGDVRMAACSYFAAVAVTADADAATDAAAVVLVPEAVVAVVAVVVVAVVADPAAAGALAAAAAKPSSGPVRAPSGTVPLLAFGSVVTSWKSMQASSH
jgi:hypothetical protein